MVCFVAMMIYVVLIRLYEEDNNSDTSEGCLGKEAKIIFYARFFLDVWMCRLF